VDDSVWYKHIHLRAIYAHDVERMMKDGWTRGVKDIWIEFCSDIPLDQITKDYDGQTNIWYFEPDVSDLEKKLLTYMVWKMNAEKTWRGK